MGDQADRDKAAPKTIQVLNFVFKELEGRDLKRRGETTAFLNQFAPSLDGAATLWMFREIETTRLLLQTGTAKA
jgi:hypothetical protein